MAATEASLLRARLLRPASLRQSEIVRPHPIADASARLEGPSSQRKPTNWSALSALRFFLAFVVLSHHLAYFQSSTFSNVFALFGGKAAVVGFFLVSGFSVSASLEHEKSGFLFRRLRRIYPAYIFAVVLAVFVQTLVGPFSVPGMDFDPSGVGKILANSIFLQSFLVRSLDFDPVVWSLSIEMFYYAVLLCLDAVPLWAAITSLVLSFVVFELPHDYGDLNIIRLVEKANMVRCWWPFLFGVMLQRYPRPRWFLLAAIIGTPLLYFSSWTGESLSCLTFIITVFCVFLAANGYGKRSLLLDRLGDVSYPLYLIHIPMFLTLTCILRATNPWLLTIAALAGAIVVNKVVEEPVWRLLKKVAAWRDEPNRQALRPRRF